LRHFVSINGGLALKPEVRHVADMLNNGYRMYNFHFKTLISSLGPKQALFQERNILEVIYFDGQNQW
jgi:hypothetical protein